METTAPKYQEVLLNAVPDNRECFDLSDLRIADARYPNQMVSALLSGAGFEVSLPFNPEQLGAQQDTYHSLVKFIYEDPTTAVGYPILTLGNTDEYPEIVAPLFVWQLNCTQESENSVKLSIKPGDYGKVNPLLLLYLSNKYPKLAESLANVKKVDGNVIHQISQNVAAATNTLFNPLDGGLTICPNELESNYIYWTAAILDYLEDEKVVLEEPKEERTPGDLFEVDNPGLIPTDTYQEGAMSLLRKHGKVVVTGRQLTGKTYTAAGMLTRVLASGGKVLYVSAKNSPVEQVAQVLERYGLGDYSLSLTNQEWDRPRLIGNLRKLLDGNSNVQKYNPENYKKDIREYKRTHRALSEAQLALHQTLFKGGNYQALVAAFLTSNANQPAFLLEAKLNSADFNLNEEEFLKISAELGQNEALFGKVQSLSHTLDSLSDAVFLQGDKKKIEKDFNQKLNAYIERIQRLYHQYIGLVEEYSSGLKSVYTEHYRVGAGQAKALSHLLNDDTEDFGESFANPGALGGIKSKFLGIFSGYYRDLGKARHLVVAKYHELRAFHEAKKYFEYKFWPIGETTSKSEIEAQLTAYGNALNLWASSIDKLSVEDAKRLNVQTNYAGLEFKSKIESLNSQFKEVLGEINQSGYLDKTYETNAILLINQRDYLGQTLDELKTLLMAMRDFSDFYDWKKDTLAMSPASRRVMDALVKVKPQSWKVAFESWYLQKFLKNYDNPSLPRGDFDADGLVRNISNLRLNVADRVHKMLSSRKVESLKAFRRNDNARYNEYFGRKNVANLEHKTLGDIFSESAAWITDAYPVVLTNIGVCEDALIEAGLTFDLVVFDDADSISNRLAEQLMALGDLKAFIGNSENVTPNLKGNSMLEEALRMELPHCTLSHSYINAESPAYNLPTGNSQAFKERVAEALSAYIDRSRIEIDAVTPDGTIDILVHPSMPDQPPFALFCDGCLSSSVSESFEDQLFATDKLKIKGYEVRTLWSADWWENPALTAKRLAHSLLARKTMEVAVEYGL